MSYHQCAAESCRMGRLLDRRTVVGAAAFGLAGLTGCAGLATAGGRATRTNLAKGKTARELEAVELAPGVKLIAGAGANVLAVNGADGALLVDGGSAEHAKGLIERALQETGAKKITHLVNTHWHPEQTGANDLLGAKATPITAHENTRLWMGAEITSRWRDKIYPPRAPRARPTDTFYTTKELPFGAEQIELGYLLQAHTDGDIYVFLRKANVIAAGGVVSGKGWPIVDWETGGWIGTGGGRGPTLNSVEIPVYGGMVGGIQAIAQLANAETRIVPADGPVLTRADLDAQIVMYAAISNRLRDMLNKGMGTEEVVATNPTKEFDEKMGNPDQFVRLAFQSLWGHVTPDA
jgi:cyclase